VNILSLFDGMSCGQIALERAGIKVDNYFASEIKPHAIKVTQHNYPKTIQLGDVTKITKDMLPKIDMVIGGSPCQDFSRADLVKAGLKGKKSRLFMEYLRIVEEVRPSFFLLENVVMDFMDKMAISEHMKTLPIRINSSLVSAQMRDRLYWTNIGPFINDLFGNRECAIPLPKDKGIKLQSILTDGVADAEKAFCLRCRSAVYSNMKILYDRIQKVGMDNIVYSAEDKNPNMPMRHFNKYELERLQNVPDGYTEILNLAKAWDLLGDGWTVDVIAHIFSFLPKEYKL